MWRRLVSKEGRFGGAAVFTVSSFAKVIEILEIARKLIQKNYRRES
jgi:hypothetical protein